jgi:hypothetical protein
MAEEKKWEKWEGPGKPEGKGGMSKPESAQPDEVGGRAQRITMITCFNCGATGAIESDAQWYTCWKCGGTAASMIA